MGREIHQHRDLPFLPFMISLTRLYNPSFEEWVFYLIILYAYHITCLHQTFDGAECGTGGHLTILQTYVRL